MTSFVEHSGIYYNVEGRPQRVQRAFIGPNLSRDTWKIIKLLQETLCKYLKYTTKLQLGTRVSKILPSFFFADVWFLKSVPLAFCPVIFDSINTEKVFNLSFKLLIEDFFMTSTLCYSSSIMAKASESLRSYSTNYGFLALV
jgi:predicted molibdopterin-dependent oxidoreductase YjgC